jgi:hypothetical protein
MKTAEKSATEKILFIDTSTNNSTVVVLNSDKMLDKVVWDGSGELSDSLLMKIEEILKNSNLNLLDISLIAVNPGPGSYTGLRIGISTVNAISWSTKIPISSAKFEGDRIKFLTPPGYNPIFPVYSGPPNITKSKKT